ncbi:General amino acid permease [Wickerhamomyces ciferrii]|uniref:General amino acid permease n=1 Tax=Wickerhamomyces ciferrii (strain ATCC 14091 / BCRC 22168 / CBS 111 / JCM 3599 / NBRC 0793 / NRRL Y-1031 F-60-10) TaxID=1206466 RepID=K0KS16_WICCF|nr:General amino acid permease [Wickerhamomyces ciferrii]CCH45956.1 General amino acid permease [Wickerhamomyces ciferrii]
MASPSSTNDTDSDRSSPGKDITKVTNSLTNVATIEKGDMSQTQLTKWQRFKDSFQRKEEVQDDSDDLEAQDPSTKKKKAPGMSSRHVALIAMAGGLGTGLLVGNGRALSLGGPGGLLIAYGIIGVMLFATMSAAGELAVSYSSLTGGFNAYAAKLVDPSLGFAIAWNYALNWLTVLPLEMVTASMTIRFWNKTINPDIFVAILLVFVILINFFGAKGYAEAEFWFNLAKVLMISGFIILGLLIDTGVAGNLGYIGAKYFQDPGPFANGFKGVCACFVTSTFSLGGTEFAVMSASSFSNPRKAIPTAIKQVFYRLLIFYFLSIFIVGLLVPYNSDRLMGSGHNDGAPVSPYVIAIESAGVTVIPHIINAVILIAVLSVGNSALFTSARTFYSLAQQGFAPKWFDYVDKQDRPLRAMLIPLIFGLFSFIAAYEDQEMIFTWLLSLSGLSTIFTWGLITLSHLRFRSAMHVQGLNVNELSYVSMTGYWGSLVALILMVFVLVSHFWVSLFPFHNDGKPSANSFFQNYLGLFSFLSLYVGHKIYSGNWKLYIKAEDIDLVSDRTIFQADVLGQEKQELDDKLKQGPLYKRILNFWC